MNPIEQIAQTCNGKIDYVSPPLPDGSGFATVSFPLPKDHWLTKDQQGFNVPPMPLRVGTSQKVMVLVGDDADTALRVFKARELLGGGPIPKAMTRHEFGEVIRSAGKYACRASTMNGSEPDFDPDAMLSNFVVGLVGYHTETGLSSDEWANPK